MAIIEICVDSLESALEANAGGADRLELCSALSTGGLTPSIGFLQAVRLRVHVAIHVMIRPRTGDFFYSAAEVAIMREDIALARQSGADGVVFGLLDQDGLIDEKATRELVESARPMQVTFHRAFDLVPDLDDALETLRRCGVHRVLTSGGAHTALEGQLELARLVRSAGDRLIIAVGGGVRPENIRELAQNTGAKEFHAGIRRATPSPIRHRAPAVYLSGPNEDEYIRRVVRAKDVQALKLAVNSDEVCLAAPEISH